MSIRAVQGVGHGEAFVPVKEDEAVDTMTMTDVSLGYDALVSEVHIKVEDLIGRDMTYPNNPATDIKSSNPKDAIGSRKVPFHLVPQQVLGEVALGMLEGACKYGAYNYRAIGVRSSVYHSAAKRHLGAWWEGQDIDPKSGLHHITKAIASLVVLRDAMIQGKCDDDRPPAAADPDWVEKLNAEAARILSEHPNPLPPYTIGRTK